MEPIGRPVFYIPIGGTRAWNDRGAPKLRWWQSGGDFAKYMAKYNCIMFDPEQPFIWTTDLGGIQFWRRWKIWGGKMSTNRDHRDWMAGGENFLRYCDSIQGPIPFENRNVITHSWGFGPLVYACFFGLRIRRLISVAAPHRKDMERIVRGARGNIERWTFVADPDSDSVADWAGFGDGEFGHHRFFDIEGLKPDQSVFIKGMGHSGILNTAMLSEWSHLCNHLR